jgi:hypothetical protein
MSFAAAEGAKHPKPASTRIPARGFLRFDNLCIVERDLMMTPVNHLNFVITQMKDSPALPNLPQADPSLVWFGNAL